MWTSKKTFSCTLLGLLFLGTSAHANLVSQGLADSSYTASGQYLTFAPKLAFDGDFSTNWNAGAHPVNWIEVDLGQAFNLALIKLSVEQAPPGATVHDVYVSNSAIGGDTSGATLAHTFSQFTSNGDILQSAISGSWRHVQVRTTSSPSWVAWDEVQVFDVPEPGTLLLMGAAMLGLGASRRRVG